MNSETVADCSKPGQVQADGASEHGIPPLTKKLSALAMEKIVFSCGVSLDGLTFQGRPHELANTKQNQ